MSKRRKMLVVVVECPIGLIESREYLLASRQTERDFTRMRKMSFTNYIWYPLTTAKRSLASGLQAFVKELLMMDRGYPSCELIRDTPEGLSVRHAPLPGIL